VPTGGDLRKAVTPPITRIDEQHRLRRFSLATELRVLWRNRGRGHGRRTSQKEKADSQNWSGMKRIGATAPKKPEPLAKKYGTPSVGASCATLRMPMTVSQRSARISKKPQWCHTRIVPKAMLVPSTDASSNRPSPAAIFQQAPLSGQQARRREHGGRHCRLAHSIRRLSSNVAVA